MKKTVLLVLGVFAKREVIIHAGRKNIKAIKLNSSFILIR